MKSKNGISLGSVYERQNTYTLASDNVLACAPVDLQSEHVLNVYLNGELVLRFVCTATWLEDLVIGRLFSERIISKMSDIRSIRFNAALTDAYVESCIKDISDEVCEIRLEESTGSEHLSRRNVLSATDYLLDEVPPAAWNPSDIFELARVFSSDSPMHRSTNGVHSCYLAYGSNIICRREDIGRHNAFDKVIGYGLANKVDFHACTVFSSGRMPLDMLTKAANAGIPIVATKSVTTDLAVRAARQCGLTLICSAWPDSMRIYNDPLHCAMPV